MELTNVNNFSTLGASLAVIVIFLASTLFPYFICRLFGGNHSKYIERKWLVTVSWFVFAVLGFLIDGMDVISASVYMYIVLIAGIQGFIFTVGGHIQDLKKMSLSLGNMIQFNADMKEKPKFSIKEVENGSN